MNTIKLSGHVKILNLNTGEVLVDGSNIITNLGKEAVARMIGGPISGEIVPSVPEMSIGNGGVSAQGVAIAPSPEQNSLENIILTDSSIDTIAVNLSLDIKKVIFTSTFDSSNVVDFGAPAFEINKVSEVGLFTSDNKLFSVKNFDQKSFDPSVPEIIQIRWEIFIP